MIFTLTENIHFQTTYAYPFISKRRLLRSDKIWKFSFVQDNRSTKIRKDYEKDNEITIVLAIVQPTVKRKRRSSIGWQRELAGSYRTEAFFALY